MGGWGFLEGFLEVMSEVENNQSILSLTSSGEVALTAEETLYWQITNSANYQLFCTYFTKKAY